MKRTLLLIFIFCAMPAMADTGIDVGIGVSATTGLNLSIGYHRAWAKSYLLRHTGVRIDFADVGPLRSAIDSAIDTYMRDGRSVGDGVKIDEGKLDAWHSSILLDYYPFSNVWRITAGYTFGAAKLDSSIFGQVANAPADRFYFNIAGDHYFYAGNDFDGSARIDWNYNGPYFGTGFDFNLGCRFGFYLDIGAVLTNQPAKLTLDVPQSQLYIYNIENKGWVPVTIPKLDADIARATADANHKLSDFRIYPMVKMGFLYRF